MNEYSNLDSKGHHLAFTCSLKGLLKNTHDTIVHELHSLALYLGLESKREPYGILQNNLRPDLSLDNLPNSQSTKLCMDVSITNTLKSNGKGEFSAIPDADLSSVGRASQATHNFKVNKYGDACAAQKFDFLPIIFESSGFIAPAFLAHLDKLVKRAADIKRIPGETLKAYCLKRLSFRLQYCFASNIIRRSHDLNGHGHGYNPLYNDQLVLEASHN